MINLKSILSLLALGSVMVDNPLPQRIVSRFLWGVALVVLSSILIGALLLAGVVLGYQQLVNHGYPETQALLYIIGGIAALVLVGVIATSCLVKRLLNDLRTNIRRPVPLTSHLGSQASSIFESFVDGLLNRNPRQ